MDGSFVCDKCSTIDNIFVTPNDGPEYECYQCRHGVWHNQFQAETYKGPEDGPMLNRPGSEGLTTSFS